MEPRGRERHRRAGRSAEHAGAGESIADSRRNRQFARDQFYFANENSMSKAASSESICQVCKKHKSPHQGTIAEVIRPSLLEFIKKRMPEWDGKGFICFDDLGEFRKNYVKEVLQDEIGELSALDNEVIESLQQHEILSSDISKQFEKKLTFGERLSDQIASFGGSWRFLITFGAVLFSWIILNAIFLLNRGF